MVVINNKHILKNSELQIQLALAQSLVNVERTRDHVFIEANQELLERMEGMEVMTKE